MTEHVIANLIGNENNAEQIADILARMGYAVTRRPTYFSVEDSYKRRFAVFDSATGTRLTVLI